MTFVLSGWAQGFQSYAPFLKLLNPYKESLCIKLLQQSSHFYVFFESQIKLLENSYIDDSIVCIVRKKVENKLTNSPYVSLLCDITTDIFVAKKFILKVSNRYTALFWIFFMAHIYSIWPPVFVTNGPLGPFFSEAGQNTEYGGWQTFQF